MATNDRQPGPHGGDGEDRTDAEQPRKSRLTLTVRRDGSDRWMATVVDIPNLVAFGDSPADAITRVKVLAVCVLLNRFDYDGLSTEDLQVVDFQLRSDA